jgi:hypothetical protein
VIVVPATKVFVLVLVAFVVPVTVPVSVSTTVTVSVAVSVVVEVVPSVAVKVTVSVVVLVATPRVGPTGFTPSPSQPPKTRTKPRIIRLSFMFILPF